MKHCFYILILFSLFSCKEKEKKENKYLYTLELSEDKIFKLDSETVQETQLIQLFTQNDSLYFSFSNAYDNSIVFYDFVSGSFVSKVKFEKEGQNGVGNFTSYYYHTKDSIYIYHQWNEKIFLLNNQSMKYKDFDFKTQSFHSETLSVPSPYPLTIAPMRKVENYMVCTGMQYNEDSKKNEPSTILYNINTGEIKFANHFPDLYKNKQWGQVFAYRYACTTFNKNTMILSYGADHNITVYNIEEDKSEEFNAGTKYFSKINPFNFKANREAAIDHYMENLCYRNILYDEYRNLYYRFAYLPYPSYNKDDKYLRRPFSVIIIDSEFNIVGETLLPEFEYLILQTFVSPDGLHIQILSDDDDFMKFKTFKIAQF